MKFKKEDLIKEIELGGKVFLFSLPPKGEMACHPFEFDEEEKFTELLFCHDNMKELEFVSATGVYAITFTACDHTDEELIAFIAECASNCKFMD